MSSYRGFAIITPWNPKQPFINGCFNGMIPNLYIENGCFTKHPFINGCLGFQVETTLNNWRTPANHKWTVPGEKKIRGPIFSWKILVIMVDTELRVQIF